MNVVVSSHLNSQNLDSNFWKTKIQEDLPLLYPIYARALLDTAPCKEHYEALVEAMQCVVNKRQGRPLPASFKSWIHLEYLTSAAIVDQKGREILYFTGELEETLVVRLALRNQGKGYMPICPAPLAAAAGMSVERFLAECPHFDSGLLTGLNHKGRSIYLFGEIHHKEFFNHVQTLMTTLATRGKIAYFKEGLPCRFELDAFQRKMGFPISANSLFGLEHPGYFSLMSCLVGIKGLKAGLKSIYRSLNWTEEGKAIWEAFIDTLGGRAAEFLKIAFVDPNNEVPNSKLKTEIGELNFRHLEVILGRLIIDRYPGIYFSEEEAECVKSCFGDIIPDYRLLQKCENLLHDKRELFFAHSIHEQLACLPEGMPVVAVVGNAHLQGLLEQLSAQCAQPLLKNQAELTARYRNLTKIPISDRDHFGELMQFSKRTSRRTLFEKIDDTVRRASLQSKLAEIRPIGCGYRLFKKVCAIVIFAERRLLAMRTYASILFKSLTDRASQHAQ